MYTLNLKTFIQQLLPPSWRYAARTNADQSQRLSWQHRLLEALLAPMQLLLSNFAAFREDTRSEIVGNMQILPLQASLSRLWGADLRIEQLGGHRFRVRLSSLGVSEAEQSRRTTSITLLLERYRLAGTSYELTNL